MSLTIIDGLGDVIRHADSVYEDVAIIRYFKRPVYITYRCFNQRTIDTLSSLLDSGIQDQWMSNCGINEYKYRVGFGQHVYECTTSLRFLWS